MNTREMIDRDNVLDNVNRMGDYFRSRLTALEKEFPEIGDVRQVGLHIGVEFVKDPESKIPLDDATKAIRNEAMKRGVIFGLAGVRRNLLKIKPPLIINQQEADEVVDTLTQALRAVLRR